MSAQSIQARTRVWRKLIIFGVVVAVVAIGYYKYSEHLSIQTLADQETGLQEYQANHPLLVYGAAFLMYVTVTALSLPMAAPMTVAYGWFFGFWRALVLVSFASTTGATLAFLLSRYLLRNYIQNKFGERLAGFNRALDREGAFYLFTLRLIPVVPFFAINVVMGLTPIRVWTYWWVSQVGMLAGTCVFVYAGTPLPSLQDVADKGVSGILTWQLFLAFALLGVFPLAGKKIMAHIRPS